ncbi:carboxyl-terminal peptidase, putative [Actinidia rufa]|uniref:Carboxyl-terminal peptidase, putative n=1 Tax=Actinidia rufa TaxID=165716 RepID=A0A7J0FYZ5_9ERIC|nr:carboxyl-terminal peptidase, putative [Actinidia rufa]
MRNFNKLKRSPDGDVIDCVLSHLQPAFDHPQLKGQKPLEPPERPKVHDSNDSVTQSFQLWANSGDSCPEGTIPIRRTTETDVLRANSIQKFGRKIRGVRHDTMSSNHEHAVAFVNGDQYYGAKASINVWAPRVTDRFEFSLSQLWVSPELYGTSILGSLLIGRLMHTKLPDATTYCAQALSKPTTRLLLGQQSLQGSKAWALVAPIRVGFAHRVLAIILVQPFENPCQHDPVWRRDSEHKIPRFSHLNAEWEAVASPTRASEKHLISETCRAGRNNVWGDYFYYGGPGRNDRCP